MTLAERFFQRKPSQKVVWRVKGSIPANVNRAHSVHADPQDRPTPRPQEIKGPRSVNPVGVEKHLLAGYTGLQAVQQTREPHTWKTNLSMKTRGTRLDHVGGEGVGTADEAEYCGLVPDGAPELLKSLAHEGASLLRVDRVHLLDLNEQKKHYITSHSTTLHYTVFLSLGLRKTGQKTRLHAPNNDQ